MRQERIAFYVVNVRTDYSFGATGKKYKGNKKNITRYKKGECVKYTRKSCDILRLSPKEVEK